MGNQNTVTISLNEYERMKNIVEKVVIYDSDNSTIESAKDFKVKKVKKVTSNCICGGCKFKCGCTLIHVIAELEAELSKCKYELYQERIGLGRSKRNPITITHLNVAMAVGVAVSSIFWCAYCFFR